MLAEGVIKQLLNTKPGDVLNQIRKNSPLIWNISNFVSMDIAANALLAFGASPAMAHAIEEAESFSQICKAINGALTINIGTFDKYWQECAMKIVLKANKAQVPWVLDPVGAGASEFRNKNATELIKLKPTVLRGNASEIISISDSQGGGKGVDSTAESNEALDAAKSLAIKYQIVVAVTGEVDYVTDGSKTLVVHGGNIMMTKVTATGCALTCLIGAGLTTDQDTIKSTANILGIYGLAADMAFKDCNGPGSLKTRLMDSLYNITPDYVDEKIKISQL